MIVLFGLATCDRCRHARRWLADEGVDARFVDLRKEGLAPETLDRWIDALGVEALVNRRGATWRNLPARSYACQSRLDPASGLGYRRIDPGRVRRVRPACIA